MTSPTTRATGRVLVLHESTGARQPFLRGLLTHDLMLRGLSFEDAYATARAVRDQIAHRETIPSAELADLIESRLETSFGSDFAPAKRVAAAPTMHVTYAGDAQPFSRGLLAQSLFAAGLNHDRAYRRVLEIQDALRAQGTDRLDSRELARFVAAQLEELEGKNIARRYRLIRRLGRLPKPTLFFVAGATGVGKSTLTLELAPLLRVYRIISTDTIRQVMRMVFASSMMPSLHRSSFEYDTDLIEPTSDTEPRDVLGASFDEQATQVCVGVRAVVDRAIAENLNVFVEAPPSSSRKTPARSRICA